MPVTGDHKPPALSTLTTLRVGGVPERLLEPATEQELVETALAVWASGEPWLLLGGGSNTVASDAGFEGTVIRVATRGIEVLQADPGTRAADGTAAAAAVIITAATTAAAAGAGDVVRVRVQAGEPWDGLVAYAVRAGWAGIEALSGIPGSVGAAPVQNIGAYGQELSSVLVAVDFLDYDSGVVRRIPAAELELGYRTSALKRGLLGVVLAVELELDGSSQSVGDGPGAGPFAGASPSGAALSTPIGYAQLADALGVRLGSRVPLAELRRAVLALRASKGMVLDAGDPDSVSAGSFFTNPIVSENFARSLPADAPRWPVTPPEPDVVTPLPPSSPVNRIGDSATTPPGEESLPSDAAAAPPASGPYLVKLSAAWLIEHAGVRRGFALPGSRAAISSKHTLAITNRGGATAAEIVQLATFVQMRVQSEFGVVLQPEPVLVGLTL